MGLYKLCEHKGRARDRCKHVWWAQFRKVRISLDKWANREIESKTDADEVFDDLKDAVRNGTFDKRGIDVPLEPTTAHVPAVREHLQGTPRVREGACDRQDDRLSLASVG